MRCAMGLVVVALGCGRVAFDRLPPDAEIRPDVETPLPDGVCRIEQLRVGPTPAHVDLAIAATKEGYVAIWVDADRAAQARAVRIAPTQEQLEVLELPYLTASALSGILEVERAIVIVSAVGSTEAVHAASLALDTAGPPSLRVDAVATHDPFAFDPGDGGDVLLRAGGGDIELSAIGPDGTITPQTSSTVNLPKQELACSRGAARGHCVWSQDGTPPGAPRECWEALVDEKPTGEPQIGSHNQVPDAERCSQMRSASVPDESSIGVWATDGVVQARYFLAEDIFRTISPAGSAPKVAFDGKRFQIAWLEPSGGLQLTSFERDGTLATRPLAAWRPAGAEAFELVHRADETVLAVLADGKLSLLTLCP